MEKVGQSTSPTSRLLVDIDLIELTGVCRASAQVRWLIDHRVPFALRRDGKPRTTWDALNRVLLAGASSQPDFSKVR